MTMPTMTSKYRFQLLYFVIIGGIVHTQLALSQTREDITPTLHLSCPNITHIIVELGELPAEISLTEVKCIVSYDDTGLSSHVFDTPSILVHAGINELTYYCADDYGNNKSCTLRVNVTTEDTTPPQCVNLPSEIRKDIPLGEPGMVVPWNEPICNDISGTAFISNRSHTPPAFFAMGRTVVSYSCTDMSGNSGHCSFPVTINKGFCESQMLNNTLVGRLTFPDIGGGLTATSKELCPVYSPMAGEPRASRACFLDLLFDSRWEEPIIHNCFQSDTRGSDLDDFRMFLNSNPVTDDNITEVSRDLADVTQMTNLTSTDLIRVSELLEIITGVKSPSSEVTSNVVETVDNVLYLEENNYADSIPRENAPSRILRSLENQLTNLHEGGNEVNFTDVRVFVGAVARSCEKDKLFSDVSFGNFFTNNKRDIRENISESDTKVLMGSLGSLADDIKALITIPYSVINKIQNGANGTIPVTFIIYRTSYLFMSNGTPRRDVDEAVESLIISATIEGKKSDNLVDPVLLRYYPKPVTGAKTESRRCVFWDFALADGFGDWSEEGCRLVSDSGDDDESLIECHCTHLTNFAVLVDIQGDIAIPALDTLSIIGCVVSIIALLITITSSLAVKTLRGKRARQILINLCIALLGLYFCFVIGINRSDLSVGCVMFSALIHYFCLASVAWMCIEATNMYLLFVRVFDTDVRGFMWKACLAAWGIPLVVVTVCVTLKSELYSSTYCFLQAQTMPFYLGVLLLIGLMLCYNFIIFTLVIRKLTCRRKKMGHDGDRRREMYRRAHNAIAISVLLGLTWVFGFLSIGGAQIILNILFIVFNSLQGFSIFIKFCLMEKEMRNVWLSWLRCEGGKDDKRIDSKSNGIFLQNNHPTGKDSPAAVKSKNSLSRELPLVSAFTQSRL